MNDNGWEPAENCHSYNPYRFSFRWNEDYSAFVATPLAWYDEASYLRYQGDNFDEG